MIIYLSLRCHHQKSSCIKMGSDESHFNVSLIVRDKVTRLCPHATAFLKRKESQSGIEPRPFCFPTQCLTARPQQLIGVYEYVNRVLTIHRNRKVYHGQGRRGYGGGGRRRVCTGVYRDYLISVHNASS